MASGIFIIDHNNQLIVLSESEFASEGIFQKLLEDYPNLLSGELIDPDSPRRWLLVDREVGIPGEENAGARWSLDHLFLDQDAIPTLVEVKRSTDTRIRREVVGQMLDYAANAVTYWPLEKIITDFEATCERNEANPEELIQELSGTDPESFWSQVKTNLRAGKVRMIFLADEIPSELKRIVEFLNEQMDPAVVLALEIKQFKADGLQTLVPTVYGNTAEAEKRKNTTAHTRKTWNEEKFFKDAASRLEPEEAEKIRSLYSWAHEKGSDISWGTGTQRGSFNPKFNHVGPRSVFTVFSDGTLQLNFGWLNETEEEEAFAEKLGKRLKEKIPSISIPSSYLDEYITFPVEAWNPHLEELIGVLEEVLFQEPSDR